MSPAELSATGRRGEINPVEVDQRQLLLSTKLFVPKLRPNRVSRPRLFERLNTCLEKTLTLVSASAGYGKTTLVSGWLQENKVQHAWLSLDESDNDPIGFLRIFLTAIQKIVPGINLDSLSLLQRTQPVQYEGVLHILVNEIAAHDSPFVLILDDFHSIHSEVNLEIVTFLIEHAPPQLHLLLITRIDPALPLFRLRAGDQLLEIRAEHLRFTREESSGFLNDVMGLRLTNDEIAALNGRTEGWIAGLQMAALSLVGRNEVHGFVSAFTGSHHYIMDYLTEEVLKLQPEKVRNFLLKTSILASMCGSLVEAVLEADETSQVDGQAMLEALESANLFVIPLDESRQWYRYHHLFTDVLHVRLEHAFPAQVPELHRKAARWYEEHNMVSEATHHAIKAGNQAHAAQLVEQNGCSLLMRGEGFTLLSWIESVSSYTQTHPWLSVLKAWGLALTGDLEQVESALQIAEGLFTPQNPDMDVKIMLGSIATVRAHMANLRGDAQLASDYAHGALEYLPANNDFSCSMRSVATSICGDASWISGNLVAARSAFLEAAQISQAAGNQYMTLIAKSNLADVLTEQGELRQAARIFTESLQHARRADGQELPIADRFHNGLATICYEWNQLEAADQHIQHCIGLCQQWGNLNLQAKCTMRLAWLEQARSNLDKAREALQSVKQMLDEGRLSPRLSKEVNLELARWRISQGSIERASQLVQQLELRVDDEIPNGREPEYVLLLRLLLAEGKYQAAISLAERLLLRAENSKRTGRAIEILILLSLTYQGMKDFNRAVDILEKAVLLAEPEGYIRVFLDEGMRMARLLLAAKVQRPGLAYVTTLISALSAPGIAEPAPVPILNSALTSRELQVLKLIEQGCSNQDIAEELVISIPTVKRHISNIYNKLGTRNRTQAVSLGRELKILG